MIQDVRCKWIWPKYIFFRLVLSSKCLPNDNSHLFVFSFLIRWFRCMCHVRLLSMYTLRNFVEFTMGRIYPFTFNSKLMSFFQNFIATILLRFRDSLLALNQSTISCRSCSNVYCRKCTVLWLLKMVMSSAKSVILLYRGNKWISFKKL